MTMSQAHLPSMSLKALERLIPTSVISLYLKLGGQDGTVSNHSLQENKSQDRDGERV
jgi:hypothetical protein